MGRKAIPAYTRFVQSIVVNPETQCWEWQGTKDRSGYGMLNAKYLDRPVVRAHRFSFLIFNGYLPETGRDVDHKCNVRHCVNPDHLRDVTHAENMENRVQSQTRCSRGHDYNAENTVYVRSGGRVCRKCRYLRIKEWRARDIDRARLVYRGFRAKDYNFKKTGETT